LLWFFFQHNSEVCFIQHNLLWLNSTSPTRTQIMTSLSVKLNFKSKSYQIRPLIYLKLVKLSCFQTKVKSSDLFPICFILLSAQIFLLSFKFTFIKYIEPNFAWLCAHLIYAQFYTCNLPYFNLAENSLHLSKNFD